MSDEIPAQTVHLADDLLGVVCTPGVPSRPREASRVTELALKRIPVTVGKAGLSPLPSRRREGVGK